MKHTLVVLLLFISVQAFEFKDLSFSLPHCLDPTIVTIEKPINDTVLKPEPGYFPRLFTGYLIYSTNDTVKVNVTGLNSGFEHQIVISYKSKVDTIYSDFVTSAGTGILEVLGMNKEGLYFKISYIKFIDFFTNKLRFAYFKFDWKSGKVVKTKF